MSNLDDVVRGYAFDDKMLAAVSEGFDTDDWLFAPPGGGNHAHWLLGHVATVRRQIVRLTGEEIETLPWEKHFAGGGRPGRVSDDVPVALLRQAYLDAGRTLRDQLVGLSEEQLDEPVERPFPDGSRTLRGAVHFFSLHEAYHLGQIGLLRRMRGKPGIA